MKQIKKTILTLVALLAVTTGAWADDLYLVVNGTSATVMYGDKGSNPYYGPDKYDSYKWLVAGETYSGYSSLTTVTIDASCQNFTGTTLEYFFCSWNALTTINNLENLNMSEVTNMSAMFGGCSSMTSFDFISSWNTAKVTNMGYMFTGVSVETLDLSGWNTSSVTNMRQMFSNCTKLETIYVGDGWSTANVTDGSYMFYNCKSLPGFDANKIDHAMAKLTTDGGYLKVKPAPSGPTVAFTRGTGDKAEEWTMDGGMPAGNVTVSVDYFPKATADGAVTAATDAKATTDAPLVTVDATMLTGVAKMMYYVSTEATAPAYDAEGWTDVLPTAEKYTEAGNVNVWYYPVGTDEGVGGATATYSDGDMNTTALTVTIAPEPTYNVEFAEGTNPEAPANPIWTASPATDVKKGQTVTVTYTGTRKVIGVKAEKKASAPTLKDALADGATVVITYTWYGDCVTTFTYTINGGTYTGNTTGDDAGNFVNGMSMEGTTLKFSASNIVTPEANVSIDFYTDTNEYVISKGSGFTSFTISVNGTDLTSQLKKVK